MPTTYRDLLAQAKQQIKEITPEEVKRLIEEHRPVRIVDVREADEWQGGHLPGATHIARGFLESKIEAAVPDRSQQVVLYCAGGVRSAFAAKTLHELGYTSVLSMAGGYGRWHDRSFPTVKPFVMTAQQKERYRRHLIIPEVGEEGQARLLRSKVLLMGAGGLGSPAALYLAAAGVGTIGIVDMDVVDLSNLQRQVIHSEKTLGVAKTESAAQAIKALNPDVDVIQFNERLTSKNVMDILFGAGVRRAQGQPGEAGPERAGGPGGQLPPGTKFDVLVDGGDNFPTRYLLNDACVVAGIPNVHGSVYRFEGQVTTFWPGRGPCYRCLYPQPPPPEMAPSCAEAGVLGVLPGVVGLLQANEALKILLGIGEPLVGRLQTFDALKSEWRTLKLRRDPACPVCQPGAKVEFIDYEQFCMVG